MTRRTAPPSPVTVRSILNAGVWGTDRRGRAAVRQYGVVCALCGGSVISVNAIIERAREEATEHLATHEQVATP